jgi:DME family drug/metabolite transporter
VQIDRSSAVWIVLLSGVLFGTTGTATVLADVDASPTSIAAARLTIGALGLVAITMVQRDLGGLIALWKLPRVWFMGLAVASYMGSFFLAVHLAGAAVASLVSISLAPMLAGAIARMFGKPWPGRIWIISTVLAVIGVMLLSAPTNDDGANRILGALAATLASASYAFYTVMGANLVDDEHHATDSLAASFSIGALLLLPFLITDFSWLASGKGLALALWLGLAATTLSYFLFGIGITHLAPGVVATLLLSEPFVATLMGVFILDEPMVLRGWIGCALIVIGLVMVSRNEARQTYS